MARKKLRHRRVDATGRNKGPSQYVPVPYFMAHHPAFRSLSGPALKIWIELRSTYNGGNNGKLSLSYQRAADLLHLSKSTVARGFAELEEKGFIKKSKQGQWYGRLASEWIVTDRGHDDKLPTNEWQDWRDERGEKQKAVPVRRRGVDIVPAEYRGPNFPEQESTAPVLVERLSA